MNSPIASIAQLGGALHRRYACLVELELTPLRFDNPYDAVKGTYGGQGKAVAVNTSAALLFEWHL